MISSTFLLFSGIPNALATFIVQFASKDSRLCSFLYNSAEAAVDHYNLAVALHSGIFKTKCFTYGRKKPLIRQGTHHQWDF